MGPPRQANLIEEKVWVMGGDKKTNISKILILFLAPTNCRGCRGRRGGPLLSYVSGDMSDINESWGKLQV